MTQEPFDRAKVADENRQLKAVLAAAAIGLVLAAVFVGPKSAERAEQAAAAAEAAKLSPAQVAKCRELLASGAEIGLIRGRPAPNRIDVEDALWAQLPAEAKDQTLAAVSCDVWQTAMPADFEHVVAYGYRSGKRLQMFTSVGMSRD